MSLKVPSGDMYDKRIIDAIWNPVSGKCIHDCPYCYVKRIANRFNNKQNEPHLNMNELHCDLGENKTIFVCSGCDLFAKDVQDDLILSVICRSLLFPNNKYIFQTKNPERILFSLFCLSADIHKFCTTIETNFQFPKVMGNTPSPYKRAKAMQKLSNKGFETMITIEPIMEFDLDKMIELIHMAQPAQVNIGADSGNNHLPEPSKEKVLELISELEKFTKVYQKNNLRRLLNAVCKT